MGAKITESAKRIICSELKLPGIHSVILIGSRARGDASAESDYDIYVVTPVSLLPLLVPILKKREKILREKLKTDVSISPLTYSRMKRGRDTLLFHTKKEGVVLCGKDVRSEISIDSPRELSESELYQYLFDAMYYAISSLGDPGCDNNKLIRGISKALLYCADLHFLRQGIYIPTKEKLVEETKEEIVEKIYKLSKMNPKYHNKLKSSAINQIWKESREYLINTAKLMGIDPSADRFHIGNSSKKVRTIRNFLFRLYNRVWVKEEIGEIITGTSKMDLKTITGFIFVILVFSLDSVIPMRVNLSKIVRVEKYANIKGRDIQNPNEIWTRLKFISSRLWKIVALKPPI